MYYLQEYSQSVNKKLEAQCIFRALSALANPRVVDKHFSPPIMNFWWSKMSIYARKIFPTSSGKSRGGWSLNIFVYEKWTLCDLKCRIMQKRCLLTTFSGTDRQTYRRAHRQSGNHRTFFFEKTLKILLPHC